MKPQYTQRQLTDALFEVGVRRGDVVFSHSNIGFFGIPDCVPKSQAVFELILNAFLEVLGDEGTLVVPTFSYSFCNNESFDPGSTPSTCGVFTELLRKYPGASRSNDPIFSVVALGKHARKLTENAAIECFGADSFWERFLRADGIICNMNFDAGSTFVHYVERCLSVPYRYDKVFTGQFVEDGRCRTGAVVFYCHDLSNHGTVAEFERLDKLCRAEGISRNVPVGRGGVVSVRARGVFDLIERNLEVEPWFLTKAGKSGEIPVPGEPDRGKETIERTAAHKALPELLQQILKQRRDAVFEGYDDLLAALAATLPMTVHKYPAGTRCGDWIVPERWQCREARITGPDGGNLFPDGHTPVMVMPHSLPFDGSVGRATMQRHLHASPDRLDAVPWIVNPYTRDWGFCCSGHFRDLLPDGDYQVRIDTSFNYGMTNVGEVIAPGESDRSFVFVARLALSGKVSIGLSALAVGLQVIDELLKRPRRRYTYRLLIVPDGVGAAAYLSRHRKLVSGIFGGLSLGSLGADFPLVLEHSYQGDTGIDRIVEGACLQLESSCRVREFGAACGEISRYFNAPGVRIPMPALARSNAGPGAAFWSHTDNDVRDGRYWQRLETGRDLLLRMVADLERLEVTEGRGGPAEPAAHACPVSRVSGDVFWPLHGGEAASGDTPGGDILADTMYGIDGTQTVAELAHRQGVSETQVLEAISELVRRELVVDCL